MGKKGNKRKTRWRVLPIGGGDDADCLYSTNEDDGDADHAAASPIATNGPGSYARAAQPGRGKLGSKPRPSGYQPAYYRPHRSVPDSRQPLVTAEKKTFNEEEYTKITTPRQDVLFKKGYLGRKRAVANAAPAPGSEAASASAAAAAAANAAAVTGAALTATGCIELAPMHNGGDCELPPGEQTDLMSPADEQPQYIYPNGYVDGVIYVNGGYEWYDPYGNVTVVVGPAPPFAGPGGGASVLAALPCQPVPLQPIEWFNPAYGVPYVAPALPSCPRERDRRKRCSADSQNCSPQSSESTDPPGSPQDGEGECEGECEGDGEVEDGMLPPLPGMMNGAEEYAVYPHAHPVQPHPPPQPQAYMYPGAYMFGQPIYSMNGITVQSTSQLPQNTDNSGSKRRKKKRRRRRRRGGVDDGSEETSSDEKDLEEPVSLTSQESSQEVESDSKNSAGSESCPTIVGCPELPERTPQSPSSSASLSPSLSPSPSPSNATEDKTALSKVNSVDPNAQQEKLNVRSEGSTEKTGTLITKSSLEGVDGNNSLSSHIPSVENSGDIHKLNETNLQTVTCNGGSNVGPVLVIAASVANGNYPVEGGKALELDNNLPAADSFSVPTCGYSGIESSTGVTDECIPKSNLQFSKPKSKGKKGLKIHKQKGQLPIQNGFSELQINEHSSNEQGTPVEMDGNETEPPTKNTIPINGSQSQSHSTAKKSEPQSETAASVGQRHQLDETTSKSNLDLSRHVPHSPDVPKKPTRTHQHRQQQKSSTSQSVSSPQQKEEQSSNISSATPQNLQTKEFNLLHQPNVLQTRQNTKADVTDRVVPVLESKLPPKEYDKCSASEKVETRTDSYEKTDFGSTDALAPDETKGTMIQAAGSGEDQSKRHPSKDVEECIHEPNESQEGATSDIQEEDKKDLRNLPTTVELNAIKLEGGSNVSNDNQSSSSNGKKSLSSFPEWATSTPPIPPPRRKKWLPNKKCSSERPPTPGKELEAKKQKEILDDTSSSSSRESEESVIDLLSSSPNKSKNSGEILHEMECVKSDAIVASNTASFDLQPDTMSLSIKAIDKDSVKDLKGTISGRETKKLKGSRKPASELFESTTCISKQSQQISKRDQSQHKYSDFKSGLLPEESSNVDAENASEMTTKTTDHTAKSYADDLACQVLDEGLSGAVNTMNKTYQSQSLSLTEAVTQWLHSQDSEEVLQIPQLLETESENEDLEEASEEESNMTGPKNVYRNPLLAPSCKSENKHDDAGIRVANLENINNLNFGKEVITLQTDNSSKPMINKNLELNKRVLQGLKHEVKDVQEQCGPNLFDCNDALATEGSSNSRFAQVPKGGIGHKECDMEDTKKSAQAMQNDECESFTSESVEYDADWENDPVILKPSPQVTAMLIRDDQASPFSLESTEDKCSYMCDPTLSVAKYYRLGPPPEKDMNGKEVTIDFDSGREDDDLEGMDALIHFSNELNEYSCSSETNAKIHSQRYPVGGSQLPVRKNNTRDANNLQIQDIYDVSYDGFTSDSGIQSEESCNEDGHKVGSRSSKSISEMNSILKRKSAILLSHLGAESPFPCGGICCILQ